MTADLNNLLGIEIPEGEKITAETVDELSNGKGDGEDE